MSRNPSSRRAVSPLLFIGALLAGTFLLLIGVSMAQEFRRRYVLQRHIRVLRADIEARAGRIKDLQQLREYLATDAYVERVARERLNYQKPGERVVVVPRPPSPSPSAAPAVRGTPEPSPAHAWFLLLFGPPPGGRGSSQGRSGTL